MINPIRISMIAAVGQNRVIGSDNSLPWNLRADMAHFVKTTRGKPVIMGRKTWDSFPKKPLPGRLNLIVTRNFLFRAEGALVAPSLGSAIGLAKGYAARKGVDEIMIIGGANVYELALPISDRLYLTEVTASPEGDAFFPQFDPREWQQTFSSHHPADEENDHAFTIKQFDRQIAR